MSTRVRRALRGLSAFYTLRTGYLLLGASLLALFAIWADRSMGWLAALGITVFMVAWAVVLPIRLESSAASGARLPRVSVGPSVFSSRTEQDRRAESQASLLGERRAWLTQIEIVRSEFIDLLRSERMSDNGRFEGLDERLDQITEVSARSEQLDGLVQKLDKVREELATHERRNAAESSRTSLSIARLRPHAAGTRKLVIVLSPQRCGSTWLFDQLRMHPAVQVLPLATVYRELGVAGRRYPGDLSTLPSVGDDIEAMEGTGVRLPALHTRFAEPDDGSAPLAIEKIHPSSVGFDANAFIAAVRAHEPAWSDGVSFLYLTREPLAAMRSFAAYQMRSERWHPDIGRAEIPDLYMRSYDFMLRVHQEYPGPVVHFENLQADPRTVLTHLYERLIPGAADPTGVATEAVEATSQSQRRTGPATRFFNTGPDTVTSAQEALEQARPDIAMVLERCRETIEQLAAEG